MVQTENVEPDALKVWKINIFKIINTRISFYSRNTHLLPPKPKSSFSHLKRGIQDFHMSYVLVPADKAANNVVVVWRLYYINTLKCELVDTNAYKLQPSLSERVIVDGHGCHTALQFGVKANRRVAEIQIFEKTYLIVIKDETDLKFKINESTLFLIGSYAKKLVASYLKMGR